MSARPVRRLALPRVGPGLVAMALALACAMAAPGATATPSDSPAVCLWLPPLRHPAVTPERGERLGGDILVRVAIDARGKLVGAELQASELPDLFIAEALRTARAGRYLPARTAGRAHAGSLILLLRFPGQAPAPAAARAALPTAPPPVTPAPEPAPASVAAMTSPGLPGKLRILDAGFGSGVEDRRLTGRSQVFPPGSRVYFWMEVDGARPGQVLRHIWIYQGREMQEIALTLKAERWPTWSYKTFFPEQRGAWLLELRDESDDLLGSWFCYCE